MDPQQVVRLNLGSGIATMPNIAPFDTPATFLSSRFIERDSVQCQAAKK